MLVNLIGSPANTSPSSDYIASSTAVEDSSKAVSIGTSDEGLAVKTRITRVSGVLSGSSAASGDGSCRPKSRESTTSFDDDVSASSSAGAGAGVGDVRGSEVGSEVISPRLASSSDGCEVEVYSYRMGVRVHVCTDLHKKQNKTFHKICT